MTSSAILLFAFVMTGVKGFAMDLVESIPTEILGWRAVQPDEWYDRETLYDYIDGGAELYLTYDFRQAMVRRFSKSEAPEIELGIYIMGSAQDAFGIFSAERQDEDVGIGQGSEYGGGLLRFWKGQYFVSILAIGDEEMARPAILALAQSVANAIPQIGEPPPMLKFLPTENLIKDRIRFFHSHQVLNRQYFLSTENILKLDRNTDAILAPYQINATKSLLLLIRYPDRSKAKSAHTAFLTNYLPEAISSHGAQTEEGNWTLSKVWDRYVIIVFDAPNKTWADQLLERAQTSLRGE